MLKTNVLIRRQIIPRGQVHYGARTRAAEFCMACRLYIRRLVEKDLYEPEQAPDAYVVVNLGRFVRLGWFVLLTVLSSVPLAQFSWAYQAGDVIVRVGPIRVDPQDVSSRGLRLNESLLPGTEIDTIDSDTQLGITGTYMFTSYFGLDLLAATPFNHNIRAKGLEVLGIRDVGKTKQLPPTLTAQFYPLGVLKPESKFQPYAGVGINMTFFFNENVSAEAERGLAAVTGVNEKYRLDLDNSIGPALQFGFDYALTDHLLFNAVAWRMHIQTDAKLRGRQTGTRIDAKGVELDPWVYMIGLGYKF